MRFNKTGHRALFMAAVCALGVQQLPGAGFALYETSARGIAMGGATVGSPAGAATLYDNPAGMTRLPGSNMEAGMSVINPAMDLDVTTPDGVTRRYSPDDKWFPPPFAYYTHQMNDSFWLGLGLYSPYGLGVEHDHPQWPGRFNSVETLITTFNLTPNVAYALNDRLSVAAGLQFMYFDIELSRNVRDVPYLLEMEGDSWGFGGSAALSWKIIDDLTLGLVYRSRVEQSVEGDAKVGPLQTTDVESDVTLPGSYTAGLNYTGMEKWNFGFIATLTEWSTYDELAIDFNPPLLGRVPRSVSEKNWDDVWRFGVGAEYQVNERLALQGGYVRDLDPIDTAANADYLLPPGDRHIMSLGMRYTTASKWQLGVALAYLILDEVTISARPEQGVLPTKFTNGDTRILSLSLARNF